MPLPWRTPADAVAIAAAAAVVADVGATPDAPFDAAIAYGLWTGRGLRDLAPNKVGTSASALLKDREDSSLPLSRRTLAFDVAAVGEDIPDTAVDVAFIA